MDHGVFLNTQAPLETSGDELARNAIVQTHTARDAGFDMMLVGQHYLCDYNMLQPRPLLGRLAPAAGGMQIGTGLVVLPLHHPIEVAEHFATLDTITDAPLIAGIGAGYRDVEFEKFEVPKDERGGRLREGAEILEALWTGPNVTYDGDYYTLENATINPRPSIKPSLWVGASSKAAVRRAAACGDALFLGPRDPISRVDAFMETYATEVGPEDGGSVTMFRDAVVAPTREDAIATGREYLLSKYERYLEWGREGIDLENEFLDIATDRFILGTPDDAIKEIYRYKNLGIDGILFRIQWPGMPNEEAVQTIQLLGDEVLPSI